MRTRFPPSPTGFVHVGSLRTALYNYLLVHHERLKGNADATFILRIEDTDQTRLVEGAVENLLKTLQWAGLEYDEGPYLKNDHQLEQKGSYGPYIQSQRTELYREHAEKLLEMGAAYLCFCTPERLEEMRKKQSEAKQAPMYDRTCLKLTPAEIESKKQAGIPYVIRQKIPRDQTLVFSDLIRGKVSFDGKTIDDQVLIKSDHFPTYHLANVVDDHFMKITHVMRGEEWLPSTPKHIFLYRAFGWQEPQFAHIPLLLNKDKTKLSKRQGDVSVEDYIQKGYCKEAIINFIALLGWHPGKGEEQEIFTMQELIEKFSLEQIHKAGAIFDIEKLNWFNFQWQKKILHQQLEAIAKKIEPEAAINRNDKNEMIYSFSSAENQNKFAAARAKILLDICQKYLPETWLQEKSLMRALITVEEKVLKSPKEISQYLEFYFQPKELNPALVLNPKMKVDQEIAQKALEESLQLLESGNDFESQQKIQQQLLALIQKLGLKNGQILWPMRVVLTHEEFSPGVFEVLWALGKEESIKRLKAGLTKIAATKL